MTHDQIEKLKSIKQSCEEFKETLNETSNSYLVNDLNFFISLLQEHLNDEVLMEELTKYFKNNPLDI